MVTLSRKRRCTRVPTVRRNHVAAADTARPIAAPCIIPGLCSRRPFPSSISHKASNASGSAASCDSINATTIKRGSWRYPSLHNRHIEESAGGSGAIAPSRLGEDVICRALPIFRNIETLCLQIEHRPIAPAERHQFVVRTELNYAAMLEHADSISMTNRRESVRNQNGCAMPRGRKQTIEDFRFPAHVELRCRFVQQHDTAAEF